MSYRLQHLACLLLCSALTACGGGDDAQDPVVPAPVVDTNPPVQIASVEQQIGPAGGTLASSGLTLNFPAGALQRATTVTLQTYAPTSGALASYRLLPPGITLPTAATATYTATTLAARTSFFWAVGDEFYAVPSTRTGTTLTASLNSLGHDLGGGTHVQTAAWSTAVAARVLASIANRTAGTRAVVAADLSPVNAVPGGGGELQVRLLDCQSQLNQLTIRVRRTDWTTDFDRGVLLYDEAFALQQECESLDMQVIRARACDAFGIAASNSEVLVVNSFDAFREVASGLMTTGGMVSVTGAGDDCAAVTSRGGSEEGIVARLLDAKFSQFLSFAAARYANAPIGEDDDPLLDILSYEHSCQLLGMDEACDRLRNELYPAIFDVLRQTGFAQCQQSGSTRALTQLYRFDGNAADNPTAKFFGAARFTVAELRDDIAYCSNPSISMRAFANALTVPDEVTGQAQTITALGAMGQYTRTAAITIPKNGSLSLGGRILASECDDGQRSADVIVARLDGREVARYDRNANDGYTLATRPLDLVIPRDLPRVGLNPDATPSRQLTLTRENWSCANHDTADKFVLFDIAITLQEESVGFAQSAWKGTMTIAYDFDYSISLATKNYRCGFIGSGDCFRTTQGSYQGRIEYTLATETAGLLAIGATGDVNVTPTSVTGSLAGSRNSSYNSTYNSSAGQCQLSANSAFAFSGNADTTGISGRSIWRLRVGADGTFEIGMGSSSHYTIPFAGAETGSGSSASSEGCPGGAGVVNVEPGPYPLAYTTRFITSFDGSVDPAANVWSGTHTVTVPRTDRACDNVLDVMRDERSTLLVTSLMASCTQRIKLSWILNRQP